MEDELEKILNDWGVENEYKENFKRQKILKVRTLKLLSERSLERLFPEEGPRLEFEALLNDFKSASDGDSLLPVTFSVLRNNSGPDLTECSDSDRQDSSDGFLDTPSLPSSSTVGPDAVDSVLGEFVVSPSDGALSLMKDTCQPPSKKPCPSTSTSFSYKDYDLLKVLTLTAEGQAVLGHYRENNELRENDRTMLADCIVNEYLRADIQRDFPEEAEKFFASQVLQIFPTERMDIWVKTNHTRTKSIGRGKLLNRYYNKRRLLVKCKLVPADKLEAQSSTSRLASILIDTGSEDANEDVSDDILWLKNNKKPEIRVHELWKKTAKGRLRMLHAVDPVKKIKMPAHEYMSLYPALQDPSGYLLFDADFEYLYPGKNLKLHSEWPKFASFIESNMSAKDKSELEDSLTPEGKKVRTLLALTNLLPVVTCVKKGRKQWRPSRTESKQGLILLVKTLADVQPELTLRKSKYEEFGLGLGPQAVIIGDEEDFITQSYVFINQLCFKMDSALQAFDIAFKATHALDTAYQKEAAREYLFLQRAIYGFETKFDAPDSNTLTLLDRYKRFCEP